jgi:hypothetical protein
LGTDNSTFALKFVYKGGRLTQILPGPSLTPEDITTIKSKVDLELRDPNAFKIATQVLFTHLRVTGSFRYRDTFQILPVPTGSPLGNSLFGGNPFLVQCAFRPSSESSLYTTRRQAQFRKIQLLLNGLLETAVAQLTGSLRANIDETESAAIITEQGGQENHRERSQDGNSYCNQFA